MGQQALQEPQDQQDHLAQPDRQGLQDPQVQLVRQEVLDLQDLQDLKDLKVCLEEHLSSIILAQQPLIQTQEQATLD